MRLPFPSSLFLISCVLLSSLATAQEPPRPNIVLIMADDLGFSDLGCYGSEIETPNLDALAEGGQRFTQFYNTAKCHSSRVSLLTGLYCDQAGGAKLNRGATIAEVLRSAGYFTTMSGKWHLDGEPTERGFDRYFGHLSGATNFFTGDNTFRLNGSHWPVPKTLNGRPFYTTHAITDFALDFLDQASETGKPFFLYMAPNAPHYPLQAPEADVRKYGGRYDAGWDVLRAGRQRKQKELGLFARSWQPAPRPVHVPAWDALSAEEKQWEASRMEVFAAMVDVLDRNIGRLVDDLVRRKLLENTLILFCSDNGACPFERTRGRKLDPWNPKSYWTYDVGWAHVGNTPFRLYKQNQHEGGISSPLIVHWPKGLKVPKGGLTHQPAHLIDIMATAIELAGAEYPETVRGNKVDPLQGRSLSPVFRGETRSPHQDLYFRFGTDRALRQGKWKLVAAKGGRWELYDVEADRTELKDVAAQHPGKVEAMSKEWRRIAREMERLSQKKIGKTRDGLTPLKFGKRNDPGAASKKRLRGVAPANRD